MPASLPPNGISLTRGGVAAVTDEDGAITGKGASGIYARDRRVIASLELRINGRRPTLLNRTRTGPAEDRLVYGYWGDWHDPAAVVVRERGLEGGYGERLELQSFRGPLELDVCIDIEPGGGTIYALDNTAGQPDMTALVRRGLTATGLAFDADALQLYGTVRLGREQTGAVGWRVALDVEQPALDRAATMRSSDPVLQTAWEHAVWDLAALTVTDPRTHLPFLAAGAPHFLAMFGRDALVASLLGMVGDPRRALDTLTALAAWQGSRYDPASLEEPGRILHELRIGDMGVLGLPAGVPYYGSIDATPLFVLVLAECLAWGADHDRLAALLPAARRAVQWCREHVDDRGFVHSTPHDRGLDNQAWKDSGDAFVRADGSVIRGATTPVEVQGYTHAALVGLAELEDHVEQDPAAAGALRTEAAGFAHRFATAFAVPAPAHLAMALEADGSPVAVCGSNVGHLLATDIIDDDMATRVAKRLLRGEEFSGWGVRTLATTEAAYNPLGYHLGTVWPHDTAMFLRGLNQRRFGPELERVAGALLDLAHATGHQLPELLGGLDRARLPTPVPYPVSARPQAWAAAVPLQVVTALLGLRPALHRRQLRLRPRLPQHLWLTIEGLRLGGRELRIEAQGRDVAVTGDTADLDVIIQR